ncbi:MAG: cytochrome c biogenesis protein [Gammaproteobacteria bacterium]
MNEVITELPWLYGGLAAYALATIIAIKGVAMSGGVASLDNKSYEKWVLLSAIAGVSLLTMALAERWVRIGHGPFVNLFELLMSQLFSLGLIFSFVYWRMPVMRPSAVVAFPLVWVIGIWVLLLDPAGVPYPPTYYNNWLWAHVGFGKVFLSFCLVGTGLAGVILLRGNQKFMKWFRIMPEDSVIDRLAWRFMLIAFIFHSLMLVAGAVWAQDAWGRYWAWDALETSSFLNWLLLGGFIHARTTYNIPMRVSAVAIFLVFIFAFLTYFGTPFYSEAAHKGVI